MGLRGPYDLYTTKEALSPLHSMPSFEFKSPKLLLRQTKPHEKRHTCEDSPDAVVGERLNDPFERCQ